MRLPLSRRVPRGGEFLKIKWNEKIMKPFLLYHWSLISRRKQILKRGLCPGSKSRDHEWNAPYICFAASPSMAWALSAGMSNKEQQWDLWMMWSNSVKGYEKLFQDGTKNPTEYRIYERVFKRDIWYVGTRKNHIHK
jgi:hypothetical protein